MPITQSRLANIVEVGQELLTQIIALKRMVRTLDVQQRVFNANAAMDHVQDAQTRLIIQDLKETMLVMYNTVIEMEIEPEMMRALEAERAHYKATRKENERQAAYQRRKRLMLGKGNYSPHTQGAHFGHTEPDDTMTGPTAPI